MKKDVLILAAVVLIIVILVNGVEIQSVEEYYLTHADDVREDSDTITMEIRCDTALANRDALPPGLQEGDYLPGDGAVLPPTQLVLREGDTAFDLLLRATRTFQIQMEYQGADANAYQSVYIQGISHLYEYSCGPLSGWMFCVNGEYPGKGCSQVTLEDGDTVLWVYTCDLGRDVGNQWGGAAS